MSYSQDLAAPSPLRLQFSAKSATASVYQATSMLTAQCQSTERIDNACTRNRILVKNNCTESWEGILKFSLMLDDDNARYFLPGFMYNRNRPQAENKHCPSLMSNSPAMPSSPFWYVRGDRLTHPVACAVTKNGTIAIAAKPFIDKADTGSGKNLFCGFGCSLEGGGSISYTIGHENAPKCYSSWDQGFIATPPGFITLASGMELSIELQLIYLPSPDPRTLGHILRLVYNQFHQAPTAKNFPDAIESTARAVCEDSWIPKIRNYATRAHLKSEFNGKPAGALDYNDIWQVPDSSISWTSGAVCATPAIMAGLRFGNKNWRQTGIDCLDTIVEQSINPKSGLPFDGFNDQTNCWENGGWWKSFIKEIGHSSYLAGSFVYYLFKAAEYEQCLGNTKHDEWIKFGEAMTDKFLSTRNSNNLFPYIWSQESGKGIDYEGMAGVWCLAAALLNVKRTGNKVLLDTLKHSEQAYFDTHVSAMECWGTPHDTFKAVDNEGILPYIRSVRMLHELTGESCYLEKLLTALDYEFSFKFCYNTPIEVPPLSRLAWPTCGGSITSTNNPHIHPMSYGIIDELAYAARITKDPYLVSRLNDSRIWSRHLPNAYDLEQDFGKKGWMTERFCHSQGLLNERYPDGSPSSVWFVFLPWASGNVLEGWCGEDWGNSEIMIQSTKF